MNSNCYTFRKEERIVSQKLIDELFSKSGSHSLVAFPIRAVYMTTGRGLQTSDYRLQTTDYRLQTADYGLQTADCRCKTSQVLMSVPKKRFRHAVDRNRVKRQLREAYRRHKHVLDGRSVGIAFIWLADTHFPSAVVDHRVKTLLTRIVKKIEPET